MTDKCTADVWHSSGFHSHVCGRPAMTHTSNGPRCGVHDPNRAPTKAQRAARARRAQEDAARERDRLARTIANALADGMIVDDASVAAYRDARERAGGRA